MSGKFSSPTLIREEKRLSQANADSANYQIRLHDIFPFDGHCTQCEVSAVIILEVRQKIASGGINKMTNECFWHDSGCVFCCNPKFGAKSNACTKTNYSIYNFFGADLNGIPDVCVLHDKNLLTKPSKSEMTGVFIVEIL